ncbi:SURF1 family cytochrome oxidase biogenesis protein [Aurantiacibacter gangjinensis]|uniref:SURF1-like protein n=1 Tax=Aurantiacibacter gangjinensis TaxID=502682 RepID=A0A0G9MN18_9SPHN|nr:SURF1 family cytochrome oxidase biogenesis protein [Aurantiacibacter gangjinensis]APE28203.1 Cytochrome oxidase biogenesis protein Surf1, facilitates heme A insertion [Aurantiacibacter gangjinensis]KLE32105.1 hypothetical protein AAW01_11895 [Aurantiacibacter gangjinensis]
MSARRIPIIATIIVVAAAAVMVVLGFWQLDRREEKAAQIAQYAVAADLPTIERFPDAALFRDPSRFESLLFRTVRMDCSNARRWRGVAGRSENGHSGYAHRYLCQQSPFGMNGEPDPDSPDIHATIGWSRGPQEPEWSGDVVIGVLAPAGDDYEVVLTQPQAGLEALARPDPGDLPNNHLAYAGQWFFFALTSLVIYWLALRRRWRDQG